MQSFLQPISPVVLAADIIQASLQEMCDGCWDFLSPDLLTPIGDGSLKVCPECRPIAERLIQSPERAAAALDSLLESLVASAS